MTRKAKSESFEAVFLETTREVGLTTNAAIARRLGIHARTAARWLDGSYSPDEHTRYMVVYHLRDATRPTLARLAASLGLDPAAVPSEPPPAPATRAAAKDALDAALLAAGDRLDVPPRQVREALMPLVLRIAELGIDAKTAHDILVNR